LTKKSFKKFFHYFKTYYYYYLILLYPIKSNYLLSLEIIVILYFPLNNSPFSAKALRVDPVVIFSGAKDKAAFLKEV